MRYEFLKNRRIRVEKIFNKNKETDEPVAVHYATGFVTSVKEINDDNIITMVNDNGEVTWFVIEPFKDKFHIKVLDWQPENPYIPKKNEKSEEDKKPNRFDIMNLDDNSETE